MNIIQTCCNIIINLWFPSDGSTPNPQTNYADKYSFMNSQFKCVVSSCFYRPQRSWAKVMFLQSSVILSTGGSLPQWMLGYHDPPSPPGADPPGTRHPLDQTPPEQTPPRLDTHPQSRHPPRADNPPQSRHPPGPHPPRSRLRDTVNERPVRILLECILVYVNWGFDS